MRKRKGKKKGERIRGQANPKDSATAVFWSQKDVFAELFNKIVFREDIVNTEFLRDASEVESAWVRLSRNLGFTLKNTRDVCKESDDVGLLAIMGLENMSYIDYELPVRVFLMDAINYARQVNLIEAEHLKEMDKIEAQDKDGKNEIVKDRQTDGKTMHAEKKTETRQTKGELLGRFRKTDRLKRVLTLSVYYGDEAWDGPLTLFDMLKGNPLVDWGENYPDGNYPLYILDVKRMTDEQINEFSPELRAFFDFLKKADSDSEEISAILMNEDSYFRSASPIMLNALAELTGSKELIELCLLEDLRTPEGGINVCAGIQYMINKATVNSDKAREEAEEAREEAEEAREKAEEALRRKAEEEEVLRRKAEEEETLRRKAEEALRRKAEEVDQIRESASKEMYVKSLQSVGKSLKETIDGFTKMFDMDQAEAKEVVARYWKSQTA